ncbi:hypothetical protein Pan110_51270 [Gimesia panareensis]|nr:hypothetical protein Pan110_51270 [Gimesia panareensis]
MPLTECDEMIQGFVFNSLHKPFDPGIYICRQLHLIATVRHDLSV